MKNKYEAPEFKIFRLTLKDIILGSPLEDPIGENIGDDPDPPIILDGEEF